jgi:hypothetical protein
VPYNFEELGVGRDAVWIVSPGGFRQGLLFCLKLWNQMPDEDVLKHIAADGVHNGALTALVNDVDHARLLLVSFGAFVVEAVKVQRDAGTD